MSAMPPDGWDADPLPITVPMDLHEAMAKAVSREFAVSYLCGAVVQAGTLHPRTQTARQRIRGLTSAMLVLSDAKLKLGDPIPIESRLLIHAVADVRRRNERNGK